MADNYFDTLSDEQIVQDTLKQFTTPAGDLRPEIFNKLDEETTTKQTPKPATEENPELTLGRLGGRFWAENKRGVQSQVASLRSQVENAQLPIDEQDFLANPKEYITGDKSNQLNEAFDPMILEPERQNLIKNIAAGMPESQAYSEAANRIMTDWKANQTKRAKWWKDIENSEALKVSAEYDKYSGYTEKVIGAVGSSAVSLVGLAIHPALGAFSILMQEQGGTQRELEGILEQYRPELSESERSALAYKMSTRLATIKTPIEFLGELITLKSGLGKAGFTRFITRLAVSSFGEGITEAVQSYPEQFGMIWALNADLPADKLQEHFWNMMNKYETHLQAWESFKVGAGAGVAISGPLEIMEQMGLQPDDLIHPDQKKINEERAIEAKETAKAAKVIEENEQANTFRTPEERQAEINRQFAQDKEEVKASTNREEFINEIRKVEKVNDEQVDTLVEILDSMAQSSVNRGFVENADEFYAQFGAEVVTPAEEVAAEPEAQPAPQAAIEGNRFSEQALDQANRRIQDIKDEIEFYKNESMLPEEERTQEISKREKTIKTLEKKLEKVKPLLEEYDRVDKEGGDTSSIAKEIDKLRSGLFEKSEKTIRGRIENRKSIFEGTKTIIKFFDQADLGTLVHETGHILEGFIYRHSPEDFNALANFVGEDTTTDPLKWKTDSHEKAARAFELYLSEGRAPNNAVRRTFEKMAQWLTQIYKTIRSKDFIFDGKQLQLTKEVRDVFDRWVGIDEKAQTTGKTLRNNGIKMADIKKFANDVGITINFIQDQYRTLAGQKVEGNRVVEDKDFVSTRKEKKIKPFYDESTESLYDKDISTPLETFHKELGIKNHDIAFEKITNESDLAKIFNDLLVEFDKEGYSKIVKTKRQRVSDAAVKKMAAKYGYDPKNLMNWTDGNTPNAAQVVAALSVLEASSENVSKLANEMKNAESDPAMNNLKRIKFIKAVHVHAAIAAKFMGARAEIGRALRAFQILPTLSNKVHMESLLEKAEQLNTSNNVPKIAREIADLFSKDDQKSILGLTQSVVKAGWKDIYKTYYINFLLSNPLTHARNFIGNGVVLGESIAEQFLGYAWGKLRQLTAKATGSEMPIDIIEFKEVAGMWQAFKTGWTEALSVYREEIKPSIQAGEGIPEKYRDYSGKVEFPGEKFGKFTTKYVQRPGDYLAVMDFLFKSGNYRMNLHNLAYQEALVKSKSDPNATVGDFAKIYSDILNDPEVYDLEHGTEIHYSAQQMAKEQTFTNRLEGIGVDLLRLSNKSVVLKTILPFVRTPLNIFKYAVQRTPVLQLFSKKLQTDLMGKNGSRAQDLARAKVTVSTGALMVIMNAVASGALSGRGPNDKKERDALYRKGWRPYSIKVPFTDTWVSYQNLDPAALTIGMIADSVEFFREFGNENADLSATLLSSILLDMVNNITSKTYMQNISEIITAIAYPDTLGKGVIERMASTVIPRAASWFTRILDPNVKDLDIGRLQRYMVRELGENPDAFDKLWVASKAEIYSVMQQMGNQIVGTRSSLVNRLNFWGEEIQLTGGATAEGALFRGLSPIYISVEQDSPVDEEIIRLQRLGFDTATQMPSDILTFDRIRTPLSSKEYHDYLKYMNSVKIGVSQKNLKDTLTDLVKSDLYKGWNDERKAKALDDRIDAAKELAKQKMRNEQSIKDYLNRKKEIIREKNLKTLRGE